MVVCTVTGAACVNIFKPQAAPITAHKSIHCK